ncbi:hypothetical protein SD70_31895, partial [Gordoniibacillus kamchatkensis]
MPPPLMLAGMKPELLLVLRRSCGQQLANPFLQTADRHVQLLQLCGRLLQLRGETPLLFPLGLQQLVLLLPAAQRQQGRGGGLLPGTRELRTGRSGDFGSVCIGLRRRRLQSEPLGSFGGEGVGIRLQRGEPGVQGVAALCIGLRRRRLQSEPLGSFGGEGVGIRLQRGEPG